MVNAQAESDFGEPGAVELVYMNHLSMRSLLEWSSYEMLLLHRLDLVTLQYSLLHIHDDARQPPPMLPLFHPGSVLMVMSFSLKIHNLFHVLVFHRQEEPGRFGMGQEDLCY